MIQERFYSKGFSGGVSRPLLENGLGIAEAELEVCTQNVVISSIVNVRMLISATLIDYFAL